MALNFDNFETVLQTKLDTITDEKDMLLLGKAIEATVGNVTVSEIQAEGTTQKNAVTAEGATQINAVQAQGTSERSQINAMSSNFATTSSLSPVATSGSATDLSNLRTVGGQSIAGVGGDIATLPAGGSVGQALVKDGSNNASWGDTISVNEGIAWLEYMDTSANFRGLYSAVGALGTQRAHLPFNTVNDPHNILNTATSNQFTVHTSGVYTLEGMMAAHSSAHQTGLYIYNDTDNTFAPRPNSTFSGVNTYSASNIGYDSNQDPQGTQAADLSWLIAGKTYSIRWSNEANSTALGTSTSWLFGNYTYNGMNQRNVLMRAVITKLGGY